MSNKGESEKSTHRFTEIRKLTNSKFLNLYEMDAIATSGNSFNYYFASRRDEENIRIKTGKLDPEGVLVYAIKEDDPTKILLINQYRYPVDRYIYEMPAGLIEPGETPNEAAIREIHEETGLIFTPYEGGDDALRRPYIFAQGISDEVGVNVFGTVKGEFSKDMQEDSEYIDAFFADISEVKRILRNEVLSLRAELLLSQFVHMTKDNPFAFLDL